LTQYSQVTNKNNNNMKGDLTRAVHSGNIAVLVG